MAYREKGERRPQRGLHRLRCPHCTRLAHHDWRVEGGSEDVYCCRRCGGVFHYDGEHAPRKASPGTTLETVSKLPLRERADLPRTASELAHRARGDAAQTRPWRDGAPSGSRGRPGRLFLLEPPRSVAVGTVLRVATTSGPGVVVVVDDTGVDIDGVHWAPDTVVAVICRLQATAHEWVSSLRLASGDRVEVFRSPSEEQCLAFAAYLEQALGLPSYHPVTLHSPSQEDGPNKPN